MTGFLKRVVFAMLLGVVLYGVIVAVTGYHKIQASLSIFHWSAFAIALGMATSNYGLRILKVGVLPRTLRDSRHPQVR